MMRCLLKMFSKTRGWATGVLLHTAYAADTRECAYGNRSDQISLHQTTLRKTYQTTNT